ncbi:hypothetical protein [Desulfonatronovibrio magnus]|uniref:hypothetical protein n=1 Tax=Desulfonatronovibrio magnus TaxID=698827 RepID=UPI0005EAEDDC|nr:hypothetical protein [Desulfonatronovibrio magnus]
MNKKPKPTVGYLTDGKGRWWRSETQPQCSDEDVFGLICQGVWGHRGVHWSYKQDGSYAYWINESDPGSIEKGIAAGWTPPDHESYVHPLDKRSEYYVTHHSVEEVVDPLVIERLENEDPPETDAYIDRPLSPDEIKHLEDTGRV